MRTALLAALAFLATPVVALAAEPPCRLTDADWAAMAQAEKPECDAPRCAMTREHVARLSAADLQDLCRTRRFYGDLAAMGPERFTDTHTMDDFPKNSRLYAGKSERLGYIAIMALVLEKQVARDSARWREFAYPDAGFAARFPLRVSKPQHYRPPNHNDVILTVDSVGDTAFMVSATDLTKLKDIPIDTLERQAAQSAGMLGMTEEKAESRVSVGGLPGREVFWKDKAGAHARIRFVVRGRWLYMIAFMDAARLGRFPDAAARRFLASFRLLPDRST
jgi:hypothetical protein